MSYYRSDSYHRLSLSAVSDFTTGAQFVESIIGAIKGAGWAKQQTLTGEVSVTVITIVHGDQITLDGNQFVFWWPPNDPPSFGIPVEISQTDTLAEIVSKFGSAIDQNMSTPESPLTTTLEGNTITVGGFSLSKNGHICSIVSATGGTWNGTTGVSGQGFIHNGGEQLLSAEVGDQDSNNSLILQVRYLSLNNGTRMLVRPISVHDLTTDPGFFDGLQLTTGNWHFAGSDKQIAIYSDVGGPGSIVVVSNMVPLVGTLDHCQFAFGPTRNNVGSDGGARTSFAGALARYWVNVFYKDHTSGTYAGGIGATNGQDPCICYPGYARGIAAVDKLGNRIGGNDLPILDENGNLLPYEPFIAFCKKDPIDFPVEAVLQIMGQLRDAMVYSKSAPLDETGFIEDDNAIVLIGQTGSTARSNGVLMLRT
jgi:hypothetical protein